VLCGCRVPQIGGLPWKVLSPGEGRQNKKGKKNERFFAKKSARVASRKYRGKKFMSLPGGEEKRGTKMKKTQRGSGDEVFAPTGG